MALCLRRVFLMLCIKVLDDGPCVGRQEGLEMSTKEERQSRRLKDDSMKDAFPNSRNLS